MIIMWYDYHQCRGVVVERQQRRGVDQITAGLGLIQQVTRHHPKNPNMIGNSDFWIPIPGAPNRN
jgi:hypothetical protein